MRVPIARAGYCCWTAIASIAKAVLHLMTSYQYHSRLQEHRFQIDEFEIAWNRCLIALMNLRMTIPLQTHRHHDNI